ncbi:MAG: RluA family pseudouridine synthase [Deltaproteobacteria bacterium]|nr:RluA family pseudouridine synthase [Deltaproteobacteria bacterium]
MTSNNFITSESEHGKRIEDILKKHFPGVTNQIIKLYLERNYITLNSKSLKKGQRIKKDSLICVARIPPDDSGWVPSVEKAPELKIVMDGTNFMVIEKPPGLPTLPRYPGDFPSLAGAVTKLLPDLVGELALPREGGIINRLDNLTSGLILVGKNHEIIERYRKYYANHHIQKTYYAVVTGHPGSDTWLEGAISNYPSSKDRVKYNPGSDAEGKRCVSYLEVIDHSKNHSLVKMVTKFGRRHQIRVQLAHLGTPIVGDIIYGGEKTEGFSDHFLWAQQIIIPDPQSHPQTRRKISISSSTLAKSWHDLLVRYNFYRHFSEVNEF